MIMQVIFNPDPAARGSQPMALEVEQGLRASLGHWVDRLTRIEVHLSDVNGGKGGDADKHCELEARAAGRPAISVTDSATTHERALHGATAKLRHALEHALGKLDDSRHGGSGH